MMKTICIVFVLMNIPSASGANQTDSNTIQTDSNKTKDFPNPFEVMKMMNKKVEPIVRNEDPKGLTLRQWIEKTECLNLASQPLMNTQFAQLGALDAIRDAGLMSKVTGLSGVSSGAFVMALAASENFANESKHFREIWPGWIKFGLKTGKDPELSDNYKNMILEKVLPKTFEELKIPMAIVAVAYDDDKAAANVDEKHAQPYVISDGELHDAVVVSSSAMMGKGCPKCKQGFSAKEFRGKWPVADGFLKDEYGTLGLAALAPCDNLLHFQPQNYAKQLAATKNKNLDTEPKEVVSLGIDVPSSGIMSMQWDGMLDKINKFMKPMGQNVQLNKAIANQDEVWEKTLYDASYNHFMERLDKPMFVDPKDDETHYFVELDTQEHWGPMRSMPEKKWDDKFDMEHTKYWTRTMERRDSMVQDRNSRMKAGTLSFRKGGNGLGAPNAHGLPKASPKVEAPKVEESAKLESKESESK